ncbi:hypothetical protein [Streptomyces hydrogenans]|uniref:hypothetical protein n=1 Tax=Streptomyces hydrogenans TaxID=1873719 RepID=UPI0035DB0017
MSDNPLMAPAPTHRNVRTLLWQGLWTAYEPLISGLRRIPLPTDVEISGGAFGITADLIDGSHLWIASTGDLPIEPAELTGFHVRRVHADNPTVDELVYDSTPDGPQAEHRNNVVPLLTAITTFVTERRLAPPVINLFSIRTAAVTETHRAQVMRGPDLFPSREEAVKEYGQLTHRMEHEAGWRLIYQTGGADWPVSVWNDLKGSIIIVFVADEGQAMS